MCKDEDEGLVVLQPHLRLEFGQSNSLSHTSTLSANMKVFMFRQYGKDARPVWFRSSFCHSPHLMAVQEVLTHKENGPNFYSATINVGLCQLCCSTGGDIKDSEAQKSSIFLGLKVKHPDTRPDFPEQHNSIRG